jgi:hypothetical protein
MIYRVVVTGVGTIFEFKNLLTHTRDRSEGLSQEPDLRGVRQHTPVWFHFVYF